MAATGKKRNQIATAFGAVLRLARTKVGLSQEALALACDMDRTYISMLERGERQPTLGTVFALSEQLGVTAESLVAQTGKALH
ncbi:helix-turn-helix domain-containing protein [Solimonas variicoloris]|uniref:helix-turn-helix domain-containing protein n=1 Tax=Solimonas variicoloris TaxID=254408 RepID=UPI000378F7CD|nr:helix-turn-helix transcriptional regulator [Solimonas variicoloris]